MWNSLIPRERICKRALCWAVLSNINSVHRQLNKNLVPNHSCQVLASHLAQGFCTKHQIQTISIMEENAFCPDVVVHTYKPCGSTVEAGTEFKMLSYWTTLLQSTYFVVSSHLLYSKSQTVFSLRYWADGWARDLTIPGVFYHWVHHRMELSNFFA